MHEDGGALHIRTNGVECTLLARTRRIPEDAGVKTTRLTEHVHGLTVTFIDERIDPQLVVLAATCGVEMFLSMNINPRLTQIKCVSTGSSLRRWIRAQFVSGLRRIDRRYRTIGINPLHVDSRTFRHRLLVTRSRLKCPTIVNESTPRQR